MEGESNYLSKVEITPSSICTNSTEIQNSSNLFKEIIAEYDYIPKQRVDFYLR